MLQKKIVYWVFVLNALIIGLSAFVWIFSDIINLLFNEIAYSTFEYSEVGISLYCTETAFFITSPYNICSFSGEKRSIFKMFSIFKLRYDWFTEVKIHRS